jgi:16S rRNA (cytosine967-C5)-methyltransferase
MNAATEKHAEPSTDAREAAALALADAAERMPRIGAMEAETARLAPADARLAAAITRHGMQRWLTLEALLDHAAGRSIAEFEPRLRGVLIASAVQLVFMDRVPAYAVLDRGVDLARRLIRPGAAKLTNAVLRKLDGLIVERREEEGAPAADVVPRIGSSVQLREEVLPDPSDLRAYLVAAWSVPRRLVDRWFERYGEEQATAMCRCAARTPPAILAMEGDRAAGHDEPGLTPHEQPGFAVWHAAQAPEGSRLGDLLDRHPAWRVQDPTSAAAVGLARDLGAVERILDFCAGRGTKTRQLAAMFPHAHIDATDTQPQRLDDLASTFADSANVRVIDPDDAWARQYDLVLLDVPCSNTGVLSRRPEARYRFSRQDLKELAAIQRRLLETASRSLTPAGRILYSTCSVEAEENDRIVQSFCDRSGFEIASQHHILPAGERDETYRDGGFAALLQSATR